MDEVKREEIRAQAKKILEDFSKSLDKVKISEKAEKGELGGFREEGATLTGNEKFRKQMFANAPAKDGDFIIAESKKW